MPRRKPISTKQRKAELQHKRAVKRGDAIPDSKPQLERQSMHSTTFSSQQKATDVSRKLQSSFIKLSPEFLEAAKQVAASALLLRPIPAERCIIPRDLVNPTWEGGSRLSILKRPKWNYDMAKKQVERNEEALFSRWLESTDKLVEEWMQARSNGKDKLDKEQEDTTDDSHDQLLSLASPTFFERNLEVWRQLWRVAEISHILLILLDSRCPPIHYPDSLHAYLTSFRPALKLIFVLTKIDITGPLRTSLWVEWLSERYTGAQIVTAESYAHMSSTTARDKQRSKPHIPVPLKSGIIDALKKAHEELCTPPPLGKSGHRREWKPLVRQDIDWSTAFKAGNPSAEPLETQCTTSVDHGAGSKSSENQALDCLTVGLIGQPNVGKSSLLNALFGTRKVKASRTPGKTKHFQTLYWSSDIRLVDCPGLVFPSFVPMELQAMSGILSIAQMPSIPACIHFVLQHLPLETIFNLRQPSATEPVIEDRRTWRDGPRPVKSKNTAGTWTAMDVLTSFANLKGWYTAKAGRPDVNRAGNYILRLVAEGKLNWAFYPPQTPSETVDQHEGRGAWIGGSEIEDVDTQSSYDDDDSSSEGDQNVPELGDSPASPIGKNSAEECEDSKSERTDQRGSQWLGIQRRSIFAMLRDVEVETPSHSSKESNDDPSSAVDSDDSGSIPLK